MTSIPDRGLVEARAFLKAVRRFMEAEYVHAKEISDHRKAGGAPMSHAHSRDDVDLAHADLMNYPAIMCDRILVALSSPKEEAGGGERLVSVPPNLTAAQQPTGPIGVTLNCPQMAWPVPTALPDREAVARLEVLIEPDSLLELIRNAYVAGCEAVQANYHPYNDPEFGEASYDYVASLDFTESTRPASALLALHQGGGDGEDHGSVACGLAPVSLPRRSQGAATPSEAPAPNITGPIAGYERMLDDVRSVWLGKQNGQFFVRFTWGEEATRVALTPEAMAALFDIYQSHYAKGGWQQVGHSMWRLLMPDDLDPETPTEDGSQSPLTSDGEGKSEGLMPTEPNPPSSPGKQDV